MERLFTDYVRSLDPAGEPPDPGRFEEVWRALGRVLKSEIRKRGLWDYPPSYLGVYGWARWSREEPGVGGERLLEAVDELLGECYAYVFVRRLDSLRVHLKVKPVIDGLVFLSVRNFLHDTQKKHDPLGFRVFEILRSAARGALRAGELHILGGDRKLRNDTVLAASADADPSELPTEALDGIVRSWNDTLLPELVTARGRARERVVAALESFLSRLPAEGVEVFRFGQLIDPLKNDVRARWGSLLESAGETACDSGDGGDGELATLVRELRPDVRAEERDSFEKLVACMAESLERLDEPARNRGYLSTLWEFLRTWAAEPEDGGPRSRGAEAAAGLGGGNLPSGRRLARLLRIPRDRLPGLYAGLGKLVAACRGAISGQAAVIPLRRGSAPPEAGETEDRRKAS